MGAAKGPYTPEQIAAIKKVVSDYTPEQRALIKKPVSSKQAKPASKTKAKPKKPYWDDAVVRVLKTLGLDSSIPAKIVVKKVRDALASEIRASRREGPKRGLILRRSGHWKPNHK